MIISRTPYRISLFGGGTDFPAWYKRHGGSVIAASINKYCYLSCRYLPPFFEHKHRIVWSKIETCKEINEIQHPSVRAIMNYLGTKDGLEIHHVGDLPARSGIGSSSSFTVGLLKGLYALQGKMINQHDLALEAIHIEQNIIKENVGSQDQVSAAYGGLNHIRFHNNGALTVVPITIPNERIRLLEDHLMLFFTGFSRNSSEVQQAFVNKIEDKKRELRIINNLTDEALGILNSDKDIKELGYLLEEAWNTKKGFSDMVSNNEIDNIHAEAINAGAISGKISGAGGGGFLLLFVPPEKRSQIRQALNKFIHVPFRFDFSGSQIMMASQEHGFEADSIAKIFEPVQEYRTMVAVEKDLIAPMNKRDFV